MRLARFVTVTVGGLILILFLVSLLMAVMPDSTNVSIPGAGINVIIDDETGCEYIFQTAPLAISLTLTPRLGKDGKPKGCGAVTAKPVEVAP